MLTYARLIAPNLHTDGTHFQTTKNSSPKFELKFVNRTSIEQPYIF